MLDKSDRNITCLRISITDRCNLRCIYCMPEEGVKLKGHDDLLSFEDIVKVVDTGVTMGIRNVRPTGFACLQMVR
ncbi:MAG: radical SAM protein [Candidatus Zixiibacteriota bacterium]|nr:MAG: radical SAM protein [candidate division Zixibacteria bacterium]